MFALDPIVSPGGGQPGTRTNAVLWAVGRRSGRGGERQRRYVHGRRRSAGALRAGALSEHREGAQRATASPPRSVEPAGCRECRATLGGTVRTQTVSVDAAVERARGAADLQYDAWPINPERGARRASCFARKSGFRVLSAVTATLSGSFTVR